MTTLVLNQIPRFPAHISASNGLTAIVQNGVDVVIVPSYGDLVAVPAVTKPSSTYFMAWDKDIDYYQSISFDQLAENLAGRVLGPTLTALINLNMAANQGIYFTSPTVAAAYDLSTFVRGISGSADAPTFRAAIGLGNVNNTSDANKPVSTLQQTALDLKANIASPTFTGDPKAPTPAPGDNDTSIATTAFVTTAISTKADLTSPTFTGDPKAPTPAPGDNDTSIATTAFVQRANNVLATANFNGVGTVAIRGSKNVSSITDNGTGNYTVNLTTPLADANYTVLATASILAPGSGNTVVLGESESNPRTTSSVTILSRIAATNAQIDVLYVNVTIIG